MKRLQTFRALSVVTALLALTACGGGGGGGGAADGNASDLFTAMVLSLASSTSDTTEPISLDGLVFGTSDTTEPAPI